MMTDEEIRSRREYIQQLGQQKMKKEFEKWIIQNRERIRVLMDEGYSRQEAFEMLKIWSIQWVAESIDSLELQ